MPPAASLETAGSGIALAELWSDLDAEERLLHFQSLHPANAGECFIALSVASQAALILDLPPAERRLWLRLLPPDEAADVIQDAPDEARASLLDLLDSTARAEVSALLVYAEDEAGGKMSPRYARLRPEMTAAQAISYLRQQRDRQLELIYYVYVLDEGEHLLGVVSFRELFSAPADRVVSSVMKRNVVSVPEDLDQEAVAHELTRAGLLAVPVVDAEGRMKGIITADDVLDVVRQEATEDIQKIGGVEALDLPYFDTRLRTLVRKRAGWLSVLFLGQMLTETAMGAFREEITQAIVLALFVPLVISSGGNSGSQASTLMIRAMALGEVRLSDWWRVIQRELMSGLWLGAILGIIGVARIVAWEGLFGSYGDQYWRIALTVSISLLGVVTWGTLTGSMLPFALRRLGFDPASASAPFVATLSDVTGLVIYFTIAKAVLLGEL
ncbi:MAG: magnesium transporter [Dehalococcoidia bacterium]|nr:magnesium transporter [Dehalococcoidia bacterium]